MNYLDIDNLSFKYRNTNTPIISEFSERFSASENIMFIGDNGTGKSTFGKLVCGLETPTVGSIKINELQPSKLKPQKRIKLSYYISQINQLQFIKSSLRGEIKLTENITKGRFNENLYHEFNLPEDMEFNPFELSVNQAWRFSLFIATIVDPIVLFIDELPSAVNQNNLDTLKKILTLRKEEYKITFLSYQRNVNLKFDRTYLIEDTIIK